MSYNQRNRIKTFEKYIHDELNSLKQWNNVFVEYLKDLMNWNNVIFDLSSTTVGYNSDHLVFDFCLENSNFMLFIKPFRRILKFCWKSNVLSHCNKEFYNLIERLLLSHPHIQFEIETLNSHLSLPSIVIPFINHVSVINSLDNTFYFSDEIHGLSSINSDEVSVLSFNSLDIDISKFIERNQELKHVRELTIRIKKSDYSIYLKKSEQTEILNRLEEFTKLQKIRLFATVGFRNEISLIIQQMWKIKINNKDILIDLCLSFKNKIAYQVKLKYAKIIINISDKTYCADVVDINFGTDKYEEINIDHNGFLNISPNLLSLSWSIKSVTIYNKLNGIQNSIDLRYPGEWMVYADTRTTVTTMIINQSYKDKIPRINSWIKQFIIRLDIDIAESSTYRWINIIESHFKESAVFKFNIFDEPKYKLTYQFDKSELDNRNVTINDFIDYFAFKNRILGINAPNVMLKDFMSMDTLKFLVSMDVGMLSN